jgi:hypothetical protein
MFYTRRRPIALLSSVGKCWSQIWRHFSLLSGIIGTTFVSRPAAYSKLACQPWSLHTLLLHPNFPTIRLQFVVYQMLCPYGLWKWRNVMKSAALHEVFRLGAGTDEGLSCEWTGGWKWEICTLHWMSNKRYKKMKKLLFDCSSQSSSANPAGTQFNNLYSTSWHRSQ